MSVSILRDIFAPIIFHRIVICSLLNFSPSLHLQLHFKQYKININYQLNITPWTVNEINEKIVVLELQYICQFPRNDAT